MNASDTSRLKLAYDAYRADREQRAPEFQARAQRIRSKLVRAQRRRRIGAPLISAFALLVAGAAYAAQGFTGEAPKVAKDDLGNALTLVASNVARGLDSTHSRALKELRFIEPVGLGMVDTVETGPPLSEAGVRVRQPSSTDARSLDGADGSGRLPQVAQRVGTNPSGSPSDEWRRVADALANQDEHQARVALTHLAESADTTTRAKALLGVLQLELAHHRCERVAEVARKIENVVGSAHRLTRRAQRLSAQCER